MKLDGKVALITGTASGIGHAIAKRYLEAGGRVVIADLNKDGAAKAAKELAGEKSAIGVGMDVSKEDQVNAGVEEAVKAFGRIDILVSNAGIQIVHPIEEFPFADWKKLLAIHLDGAFLTTKACVKHMYKQNSGTLIYMGSVHSHEASPLKSAYVAAKHGLLGLARVMAKEGAKHNVRANVICPGFVLTPLVEKQIPEQAAKPGITEEQVVKDVLLAETVDKQFTTVEDVAEVALFPRRLQNQCADGPIHLRQPWLASDLKGPTLIRPSAAAGLSKSQDAFGVEVGAAVEEKGQVGATDVTEAVIPKSGHWLMEEQPAATVAAICDFLDKTG